MLRAMNQEELTQRNIGQNLDDLMNLDPRGYGVCRILYRASRHYAGEPLTMHTAKQLVKTVKKGDLVYIMTGFVLTPSRCAETDGIIGAMLLARALVRAFGARPVIVCAQENLPAVKSLRRRGAALLRLRRRNEAVPVFAGRAAVYQG